MSAYHRVFIRSPSPVSRLLPDISSAVGAPIEPAHGGPAQYAGHVRDAAVDVELSHGYEDDGALDFTAYPIVVTIRSRDGNHARQEQLARHLGNVLAAQGHSVLVTFDLQLLLDRHGP